MPATTIVAEPAAPPVPALEPQVTDELVSDEFLVEEISIDGMCGVY